MCPVWGVLQIEWILDRNLDLDRERKTSGKANFMKTIKASAIFVFYKMEKKNIAEKPSFIPWYWTHNAYTCNIVTSVTEGWGQRGKAFHTILKLCCSRFTSEWYLLLMLNVILKWEPQRNTYRTYPLNQSLPWSLYKYANHTEPWAYLFPYNLSWGNYIIIMPFLLKKKALFLAVESKAKHYLLGEII